MRGRSPRPLDDGGIFSFSTGCEANRATSDKYTQVFTLAQLTACRAEFQRFHATALASTQMAHTPITRRSSRSPRPVDSASVFSATGKTASVSSTSIQTAYPYSTQHRNQMTFHAAHSSKPMISRATLPLLMNYHKLY